MVDCPAVQWESRVAGRVAVQSIVLLGSVPRRSETACPPKFRCQQFQLRHIELRYPTLAADQVLQQVFLGAGVSHAGRA